jgi:hypothetical protein
MRTSISQVVADQINCQMLTRDGQRCNKPGEAGLPSGICAAHASEVFRAVNRLIDVAREAGR